MGDQNPLNSIDLPTPPPSEPDGHYEGYKTLGGTITAGTSVAKIFAMDYASLLSGPLVDIIVGAGDDQRQWSIHRNLLVHRSPYFAERFNGEQSNVNSTPSIVELADDSSAAFGILVKWLYQGVIDDVAAFDMDKKWDYAFACQQLYHLCERLRIPQLKNAAIDQFRRGCYEAGLCPGPEEMMPVYENTSHGDPFRKLVSRIAARQIMDPDSVDDASTYRQCFENSADFAIDVINVIKAGVGGKLLEDPTELVGCEYHDHLEDPVCSLNTRQFSTGSSILKKTVKWRESG